MIHPSFATMVLPAPAVLRKTMLGVGNQALTSVMLAQINHVVAGLVQKQPFYPTFEIPEPFPSLPHLSATVE